MRILIGTILAVAAVTVAAVFLYAAGLCLCRTVTDFMNHYE